MTEIAPVYEDERQILSAEFCRVVELATDYEMGLRERGRIPIYGGDKIAGLRMSIGGNDIEYSRYKLDGSCMSYDLRFKTEYSVSIVQSHSFFNTFIDRATFGVNENGVIVRGTCEGDNIFGDKTRRELDLEESAALVAFVTSPQLNLDKLDLIYRLSDEDKARIQEQAEHRAKLAKQRQKEEERAQRNRRVRIPNLGIYFRH